MIFLSHSNYKEVHGGVEVYAREFAKVFPGAQFYDFNSKIDALGDTHLLPFKEPIRAKKLGGFVKSKIGNQIVATNGMFCWNLPKETVQINICHGTYAAFAEKTFGFADPEFYRLRYVYSGFEKIAAQKAKIVVANSKSTSANIRKYFGLGSKVIYPPVDSDLFYPQNRTSAAKKLGWEGTNVLFVGRPEKVKGFDLVEECARRMPQVNFKCILSRPYSSDLPNVQILSSVKRQELANYYNAADAVLFPSRFEGFGLVAAEALSCNAKIVSLGAGITGEIESENVLLSKPNSAQLQTAIEQAISAKPSNSRTLSKKLLSAKEFTKKWKEIIEEL